MDFSERLKVLLKTNNMSQSDLCKKTGIPTSLMSNYCSSKKSPALNNAIAMADAFKVTLDDLVGRTNATNVNLSDAHKKVVRQVEQLTDVQLKSVRDFINFIK